MRHFFIRCVAIALAIACVGAIEINKKSEFSTTPARSAKMQFGSRMDKAEKEYQAKAAAARKDYIAELEKAQKEATRLADLDEAVRIRDVLDDLRKQEAAALATAHARENDDAAALRARVVGTTWSWASGRRITFLPDGTIARSDNYGTGRWAALDDHTLLVRYPNDVIDSIVFDEQFIKYTGLGHAPSNKFEASRVK